MKKIALLTLSIALPLTAMAEESAQANSKGFVDDSKLDLLYRNFYFYRNFLNRAPGTQNYVEEWAHALMLNYRSGYTTGTVGFGLDLQGYFAQELDGGPGRTGSGLMPVGSDGHVQSIQTRVNPVVKMRISNTVLKYGSQQPVNPVFNYSDSRLLPQSYTGFTLQSNEFKDVTLDSGYFTAASSRVDQDHDSPIGLTFTNSNARIDARSARYAGVTYKPTKSLTLVGYGSQLEDVWNQYYVGGTYAAPINDKLAFDTAFNLYRTLSEVTEKAGTISNTTWSLAGGLSYGSHRIKLAYQQVDGDEAFDHQGAQGQYGVLWLANSVQYSDFNGPNEKSAQIRYDYDFAGAGIPGLSFMVRYVKGWDIDGSHANNFYANRYGDDVKQWERDIDLRYVVQSGKAKGLNFQVRSATARATDANALTDLNEVRIITQYPFSTL
ncbi:OprD family porin [Pseudomonas oryzihabitans]|uniref:OprD family porin n=1 Tax=Pseudomonas oryzihabitans TaxID=47885 RepID=UPI002894D43E|nr:OprD family porin [Pseudomonas oryzihabitans]MDT3723068.1 OprD family porin [Pseudomonas oryzihabitans]